MKVEPNGGLPNYLLFLSPVQNNQSNESNANTVTSAPQSIRFSKPQIKLIPGVSINYVPSVEGKVDSWSLSPTLPTGLDFSSTNGAISGTPDSSYLTTGYPLTTFTITATNSLGSTPATFELQVLATGEKVWTVINGVSGGNTEAGTNSMKFDASCNCLYIAGQTTVNLDGQTIPSTGGNASGYLSKYDLDGNRIWTRLFGVTGASGSGVTGLVTDASGNIFISGFMGTGNFQGCNVTNTYSGFILKYNSEGTFQWTTCTDPAVRHYYSGVVIDSAGDVVGGGTTYDQPISGMTHSSGSDQAAIIQKFNPNTGARISGIAIPGNSARGTDGEGISIDTTGKIYMAVATRSGSYCGDGSLNWRPALFRFDSSMNYLGCTFIPTGAYTSFAFGVTTTPAGESYLSGYANTAATFDSIPAIGTTDGFVTKFNSAGTKVWTRRFGVTGGFTSILSVEYESTLDTLYFTGITGGNIQGNVISGTKDMFIAKYDTSGNQIWLRIQGLQNDTAGASLSDRTSIAFDTSMTMYSFSNTNGTVSGVTNPASPNRSLFLVRNVR
ncbi:MAG: putative Ig domain-containing protein [Leptospira sp.]|nr:putative Ig domain-containing protein [Leptospira sp.]